MSELWQVNKNSIFKMLKVFIFTCNQNYFFLCLWLISLWEYIGVKNALLAAQLLSNSSWSD